MTKPIVYDLFCGLGGWAEGFLSEGYECIGYDIEKHDYGTGTYPGTLILCDVRSIHGSQLADATCIVASPPCQAYSYRAMPWKRAKALPPPDNTLFNECFRIQREASEAAGHYIPMVVENVKGAQPWVGRSRWNYGSFHLWGDVPALMPITAIFKNKSRGSWFAIGSPGQTQLRGNPVNGIKQHGSGREWFAGEGTIGRTTSSGSKARKAASAEIAKIPFPLASWIARCFKPRQSQTVNEKEGRVSSFPALLA